MLQAEGRSNFQISMRLQGWCLPTDLMTKGRGRAEMPVFARHAIGTQMGGLRWQVRVFRGLQIADMLRASKNCHWSALPTPLSTSLRAKTPSTDSGG